MHMMLLQITRLRVATSCKRGYVTGSNCFQELTRNYPSFWVKDLTTSGMIIWRRIKEWSSWTKSPALKGSFSRRVSPLLEAFTVIHRPAFGLGFRTIGCEGSQLEQWPRTVDIHLSIPQVVCHCGTDLVSWMYGGLYSAAPENVSRRRPECAHFILRIVVWHPGANNRQCSILRQDWPIHRPFCPFPWRYSHQ